MFFPWSRTAPKKMDILFYNAIKRARGTYHRSILLHLAKFLLLLIFHIVDSTALKSDRTLLFVFMKLAMVVCLINAAICFMTARIAFGSNSDNNKHFLKIAASGGHVVEETLAKPEDIANLELCVSQRVYNAASGALDNDNTGLTPEIREKY